MVFSYLGLLGPIAFILGAQLVMKSVIKPFLATLLAIGLPYVVNITVGWVKESGLHQVALSAVFPLSGITIGAIQFVITYFLFKKLWNDDEYSAMAAFIWIVSGLAAVLIVVPAIVGKVFSL